MPDKDLSEKPSQEPRIGHVSAGDSPLTPELQGFIKRTLVPLLVQRYIEKMKQQADETVHAASLPPAQ